ncbi:UNVERIFIED_CONTAM: hypothetical protein FKN15_022150 [Acipenser sinensis]
MSCDELKKELNLRKQAHEFFSRVFETVASPLQAAHPPYKNKNLKIIRPQASHKRQASTVWLTSGSESIVRALQRETELVRC